MDRRRFASLVGSPESTVRFSYAGRPLTDLSRNLIAERVPDGAQIVFLGSMTGDESHSVSRWWVPGIGRRDLTVKRSALAKIIDDMQPVETVVEVPAQASLFG